MSVVSNRPLEEHPLVLCPPRNLPPQPWPLLFSVSWLLLYHMCSFALYMPNAFPWPWHGDYSDFVYVPSSCMQCRLNHSPIIQFLLMLQTTPPVIIIIIYLFWWGFSWMGCSHLYPPLTTWAKFFASSCLLASFHIYSGWRSDYWNFLLSNSSWSWVSTIERSYISILFPG